MKTITIEEDYPRPTAIVVDIVITFIDHYDKPPFFSMDFESQWMTGWKKYDALINLLCAHFDEVEENKVRKMLEYPT